MDPHYNNKCVDGVEGVDHEYHNGTSWYVGTSSNQQWISNYQFHTEMMCRINMVTIMSILVPLEISLGTTRLSCGLPGGDEGKVGFDPREEFSIKFRIPLIR